MKNIETPETSKSSDLSKTFEKFDRLPDAALKNVTASSETSGVGAVSLNEVLQGSKHTEATDIPGLEDAPTDTNPQPSGESAVKAPVLTQAGNKQSLAIGQVFTGKAGLEIFDMLFPGLIVIAAGYLSYEIDKKDLQLTAKEKETIAPFMQAYLDSLSVQMSPLSALIAVMSGVYAGKFMEIYPNIKKKARTQQAKVVKLDPKLAEAEMQEAISKQEAIKKRNAEYAAFVAPMQYDAAIKHIKTTKKMSIKQAEAFYRNNVEPLKKKAK